MLVSVVFLATQAMHGLKGPLVRRRRARSEMEKRARPGVRQVMSSAEQRTTHRRCQSTIALLLWSLLVARCSLLSSWSTGRLVVSVCATASPAPHNSPEEDACVVHGLRASWCSYQLQAARACVRI